MTRIADISEVLLELGLSGSATDEERAVVNQAVVRAEGAVKRYLRYDPTHGIRTEYLPQQDLSRPGREHVWDASDTQAYLREVAGAATSELQLTHLPVRSVTSVHVDCDGRSGTSSGAFGTDSLKTEGTDFWANYDVLDGDGNKFCADGVLRSVGLWPATPGTVKVVYASGYSAAELRGRDDLIDASPILEAVAGEAARRVRHMMVLKKKTGVGFAAGTLTSEHLGDYSYSVSPGSAEQAIGGKGDLSSEAKALLEPFVNMSFVF